jgi:ankyrin repeat protein
VLLDRGADPSAEDNKSQSSLLLAVSNGCPEVVSVLMNRLDRLGRSFEVEKVDSLGRTPLILAVLGGHADVARLLLRRGVDVNRADNTGLRAIDHAAFEHNQRMLSLLFEHGESPHQVLYDGWTLDEACQEKPECLAVIRSWRNALAIDSVIREASSYHTKPTFQQ